MKKYAVILAAGKGVRMKSDLPKVSHKLCGKPMIVRVLETVKKLGLDGIFVVVGYKAELVKQECEPFKVKFAEQTEQLGTGHAVMQALPFIPQDSITIVLAGDVPLLTTKTLNDLMDLHIKNSASATVLTADMEDPFSYGRIVRSADGKLNKIVEQKDTNDEEKAIKEINSGTYCFTTKDLFSALKQIKPNNVQKEYYLTDVIGIMNNAGLGVFACKAGDAKEIIGINTIEDLQALEGKLKNALQCE
jgi:UDP-N-acetylglucosamine diphosphorylase/glucosamine-1-phosphate N-acetyltransferase